jgi:chaperone modulatory protein CbpM
MKTQTILTGIVVDEDAEFTLIELSQACGRSTEWIIELVEEGVIEPGGTDQADWRFRGTCLRRVQIAQRLESDLGVNLPGAALALELLDEVDRLRRRLGS